MRRTAYLASIVLIAAAFLPGCTSEPAQPQTKSTEPTDTETSNTEPEVEVIPDDSDAVEALKAVGAQLKFNGKGQTVEVNLRGTEAGDEHLEAIAKLNVVRSVLLNDLSITDAGLKVLGDSQLPLENLDLRGCPVSNAGMEHLTPLKTLRALRLSGKSGSTTVDDDGMVHIVKLENLEVLPLDHLWVSEIGLEQLSNLKKLRELYMAGTTISDEAIAVMKQFPNLQKAENFSKPDFRCRARSPCRVHESAGA